jgi:hypothetical protein
MKENIELRNAVLRGPSWYIHRMLGVLIQLLLCSNDKPHHITTKLNTVSDEMKRMNISLISPQINRFLLSKRR